MPDTATQLYPTAQPRVNSYRSVLTDAGGLGAGLLIGEERLAWARQERVDCTSAWFPGRLLSRVSSKEFYPSLSAEVTGCAVVATGGLGFGRGAILMRAGGCDVIGDAGPAGLGGSRRWAAVVEVVIADSHRRGKA
jgi:hypothetical protein